MARRLLLSAALVSIFAVSMPAAAAPTSGAISSLWTRWGTGFVKDLATGDMNGDGTQELVVGGRGVGTLTKQSIKRGAFDWLNKWEGVPAGTNTFDDHWVEDMALEDVNLDGAKDAIVGTREGVFAIDGRTGATLWGANGSSDENDFQIGGFRIAVTDLSGDGVPDVAFGHLIDNHITAVDGRNGSRLWSYSRQGVILDMATGDVNGDGFGDVVVVGDVDVGFQIHAISGIPVPAGGTPAPLWVQTFPGIGILPAPLVGGGISDARVVLVDQVVAGDTPEVVVAGSESAISVLEGRTGLVVRQWNVTGYLTDVVTANIDADADRELIASTGVNRGEGPRNLQAFQYEGLGVPVWTFNTPDSVWDLQAADLDADGDEEVVAVGGYREMGGLQELDGFAVAVDPRGGTTLVPPPTLWSTGVSEWQGQVTFGEVSGKPTVVLGGGDEGGVHGLDPATGAIEWYFRTGARVEDVTSGDLDGDGIPELVEAADDSTVAVHDAEGALRWQARVPGKGGADVAMATVADVHPRPGSEVIAGTFEFELVGPGGRLITYSADGQRLWMHDLPGAVDELEADDLDHDGATDIVAVTSIDGVVGRYSGTGQVVWEVPVETVIGGTMALHDLNGDGTKDVVVGQKPWSGPGMLFAFDGRNGDALWDFQTNAGVTWIDASPAEGVLLGDLGGGLYRMKGDGTTRWFTAPDGGASWDGEWTFDADGDGVRDVLTGQESGAVRLLSGVDASEIWAGSTALGRAFSISTLHSANGPRVAVGAFSGSADPAPSIVILEGTDGTQVGGAVTHYFVMDMTAVDVDGDGNDELLAASGWQLHLLDVA